MIGHVATVMFGVWIAWAIGNRIRRRPFEHSLEVLMAFLAVLTAMWVQEWRRL